MNVRSGGWSGRREREDGPRLAPSSAISAIGHGVLVAGMTNRAPPREQPSGRFIIVPGGVHRFLENTQPRRVYPVVGKL